jgi:hypothetical protein
MGKNKSSEGRKRSAPPPIEDFLWECTICTYKNNPEAFKCIMCGVSKGTSTRKSRINPEHLRVQVQQALLPPSPVQTPRANTSFGESSSSLEEQAQGSFSSHKKKSTPKARKPKTTKARSQLENIDPSTATTMDITVDDVTIPITEYKLKKTTPSDTSRESSVSREPLNGNKINNDEPNVPNKQDSDDDSDS